jgi:hypothetical protein
MALNEAFQVEHINEQGSGAPRPFEVLFASNLAWTPLLLFATIGLFLFCWREPRVGAHRLLGLLSLHRVSPRLGGHLFHSPRAMLAVAIAFLAVFLLWSGVLTFQWGSHLIPGRGSISFSEMIHNQFFVVSRQLTAGPESYLFRRKALNVQTSLLSFTLIQGAFHFFRRFRSTRAASFTHPNLASLSDTAVFSGTLRTVRSDFVSEFHLDQWLPSPHARRTAPTWQGSRRKP